MPEWIKAVSDEPASALLSNIHHNQAFEKIDIHRLEEELITETTLYGLGRWCATVTEKAVWSAFISIITTTFTNDSDLDSNLGKLPCAINCGFALTSWLTHDWQWSGCPGLAWICKATLRLINIRHAAPLYLDRLIFIFPPFKSRYEFNYTCAASTRTSTCILGVLG